jgi:hypothetical protein
MISFADAPVIKQRRRKPSAVTPSHNFMDVAAAVREIAAIIDPDAFAKGDIRRCATAMDKARAAVAAYTRILGTEHKVRVIVKERGKTLRAFTVTKGKRA